MTKINWHYELAPSTSCAVPQCWGPQCRPGPGPLEEQGVSHRPLSEACPGAQRPLLQGGPAHKPPGSSSAPLCVPGHHEDKRWAGSTRAWSPTLVPGDRAPPRGGQPGQTEETAGPLRAPAPTPAASRARDEAWGMRAQTRHLEGRGRRPGPRSGPGFRDPRWDGVASEVSVRVRRGLEGCGEQWLHPQAPREGLEHRGGRHPGHVHTPTA